MRPLTAITALLALLVSLGLTATAGGVLRPPPGGGRTGSSTGGSTAPVFVVAGSGNGHGVGLSQYGALAQARAGRGATDILSFYFPGTQLVHRPATKLRILLASGVKSLSVSSTAPFIARDAAGQAHELPAGTTTIGPGLEVPVDGEATALMGPLTLVPAEGALVSVGAHAYRGTIAVSSTGAALDAIDVVGVEAYVQGVVPAEVPSVWPSAALQAQAIAARSYALATRVKGKAWDLYPDGRSQQYLGAGGETPETTAAVRATAGNVLLYNGSVATTFYSSSSGGRTQSGLDAFGLDVPYLPAQADPWDATSPFHVWQPHVLTGQQLGKAVGLSSPVVDVQARFSPSGRVAALTVTAADGSSLALAGSEARNRLAFRSTSFHLATLRFLTPPTASSPGVAVRLAGVARDAQGATLERLDPDGTWKTVVRRLPVTSTGTFAAVVRPTQTTTYRLSASGLPGPELTIPVVGAQA